MKINKRMVSVIAGIGICMAIWLCLSVQAGAAEQLFFDSQGNLHMTTRDRIATSSITYKTIGWTIKRYDMPIDAEGNQTVIISLMDDGMPQVDPENPAYQYCNFWCDKGTIFDRIGMVSLEWQQELYSQGGTVYLDAIMTVRYSGIEQGGLTSNGDVRWGRVYYTFEGIAHAESWADREALRSHYDKAVFFPGNPELLYPSYAYQIRHYEYFDDSPDIWPMSRFMSDRSGQCLRNERLEVVPEDYTAYYFSYISACVQKYYADGRVDLVWTAEYPIVIENSDSTLQFVDIGLYYKRQNHISYLSDRFHMKGDEIEVEGEAVIGAGTKEKKTFQTSLGVPTGEDLFVDGRANAFAYKVQYGRHYGNRTKPVCIVSVYDCQWTDESGNLCVEPMIVPETYYVEAVYSYWKIIDIEVYSLKNVHLYNYAFQGGKTSLTNLYEPEIVIERKDENIWSERVDEYWVHGGILTGNGTKPDFPYGIRQAEANLYSSRFMVANDTFSIDGEVFLNGNTLPTFSGDPKIGSVSGKIDFYKEGQKIPCEKRNGMDYESLAKVEYVRYSDGGWIEQELAAVNPVTLHTPSVCHGFVTDERMFNQLCKPDDRRKTLILGREFEIKISAEGEHRDQMGYGRQNYERYVGNYQIKLPFEVYYGGVYREANTWINYVEDQKFYLPTGVQEGAYTINVRTLAYNYQNIDDDKIQEYANYDISNYGACDFMEVMVVGRLYGMGIFHISGQTWESVFGMPSHFTYTIGLQDLNGNLVKQEKWATIPILEGGNPSFPEEEGASMGTQFQFHIETIGDYGESDGIVIEPVYYVMDKDGKNRKQVDVYHFYEEENQQKWENIWMHAESGVQYLGAESRENIGTESNNIMDEEAARASVQSWSGYFCVPDNVFVVPCGMDVEEYITERGSIALGDECFIKDGYLMVQFYICSLKEGERHLSYINEENSCNGYANMWQIEGFNNPKLREDGSEFLLEYGDVFLYDLARHQKDSHEIMGTH